MIRGDFSRGEKATVQLQENRPVSQVTANIALANSNFIQGHGIVFLRYVRIEHSENKIFTYFENEVGPGVLQSNVQQTYNL